MNFAADGIVIRRAEYKDYDRMLTVFAPEHGRIDAIARGCRRPKSRLAHASEPFCSGEFVFSESKGRSSVVQCDVRDRFYPLREDYERMTHGCYYLTLADAAALPGQEARDLYVLLMKALAILAYSELEPALVTMAFEMRYMPLMGYTPQSGYCLVCGSEIAGACRFDAEAGGTICLSCPSAAPRMTEGARRILFKAPVTDMGATQLLAGHPDWKLAARIYRPFVLRRIDRRNEKVTPELP